MSIVASYLTLSSAARSPPITSSTTLASLTYNLLGGPGSHLAGPAKCNGIKHTEMERVVPLSTGWYVNGSLCGRKIRITSGAISVVAKIVDECNSACGCRSLLAPPCGNNVIEATKAVFRAILLVPIGSVSVHW
ncbi:putative ripening-related protein 1 [Acorus gramineus]|uniref:Ripening-related protein 1 n=1 Tax=Acorus gramineus TaxID=55184 RepID=A0AAV9AQL5_ACOGR|nr:putative ripening-related protein 1 [Acorus gramineus]